jgi:hypothetical protein
VHNKKFLLIGPTESVLTKRGNRFPDFANFLHKNGAQIEYYTTDFYHAEKRRFTIKEIFEAKTICPYKLIVWHVLGYSGNISIRRLISNFLFSSILFIRLISRVKKADSIIIPSRPVELIFFVSLIKLIKGSKIYLDIQDIWPDALQINHKFRKKVFTYYCNIFLRNSLKRYTYTFHTAPSFVNWLRRYSKNTPSVFLPLGWDTSRWEDKLTGVVPQTEMNQNEFNLVVVAQLQHQIDIMPVLDFLRTNSNYSLTIIGEDGNGERYGDVTAFIKHNEIRNVKFVGVVAREKMSDHLRDKDIGLLPMITTSIPNKIFDYLGAKLPIVVLGKNDSSDFVDKFDIGWSCNYNSESFESLMKSISWGNLVKKKANVEKVRMHFCRDNLHEEFFKIVTAKCNNLHKS